MKLLELFCGTKSVGKVFEAHGWEVVSVDLNPKFKPTIVADVMSLPTTIGVGFDFCHFSPPCTEYSIAHTGNARDLDSANALVKHCLAIIRDSKPRFWTIENPASGLLKKMEFMQDYNYSIGSYCKYDFPYRKNTIIWNNFDLTLLKCNYDCDSIYKFNKRWRHKTHAQKGPSFKDGLGDVCYKSTDLYRIPEKFVLEIYNAISARAQTVS